MNDRIKWKAEIEFEGNEAELSQLVESLRALPVVVNIPEWPRPYPFPGIVAVEAILGREALERFATGQRALNIKPGLINGGYPGPHIHLDGRVILLDREQFAELAGEVARKLATQLAASKEEYVPVAKSLANLQGNL